MVNPARTVALRAGEKIAALGQGTWHFGESTGRWSDEVASIRLGIDLGMTVIDTAEMYGDGAAESLVGEAIAGRRDGVFLVDKVLPHHATREGTVRACQASLRRLGVDHIDLYLLHWRGRIPLAETIEGFAELTRDGMIRHWGVSNFDVDDMIELSGIRGGDGVQTDQILYNPTRRGPEYALLPWLDLAGVPTMAYSPIEQGRLLDHPALRSIALRHNATAAQIALAWVLDRDGVIAIPRAGTPSHVRENASARDIELTRDDLAVLDRAFPPPTRPRPLEML
ncbi:oxidoreductase [Mycolicibacterium madagascariense]|uniref:Oxidoreductase n=1 Tax=Mycolicibacterium madagascariense TaxID=212765 RepID=A0A7I7X935_9MYCO|nr:aldo/keto reductase [Mycolicibacterium madagascariense]MCV7013421.1 aldo/keto reductase [Mycolicibacterium madagascariense]BBZ25860.1 oxidoreductase [Mycolicibacterium madagascariense]